MRWFLPVKLLVIALILVPAAVVFAFLATVVLTPLPSPDKPTAAEFYDINGQMISRRFTENRLEVPLAQVPLTLRHAIVAAEDDRFYQHRGLDPRGLFRALWRNVVARRVVEGGSTITQQLARNLYLSHERTVWRKLRELVYSLKLESQYSKDEILEMYLNTIYLGQGAHGVEVASETYFGKSVRDLTLPEAALIAGLPRGPELYNPFINLTGATERRNEVLARMVAVGYLDAEQMNAVLATPVVLVREPEEAGGAAYFLSYVEEQLKTQYPEVHRNLLKGGYKIFTTLDMKMQRAAVRALREGLPSPPAGEEGSLQPQGAIVALEPRTGHIKALVGGRDYRKSPFNRAVQARRQPGSAFKPFMYAAVLKTEYYTAGSVQTCEPVTFPGGTGHPNWSPKDFDPRKPYHYRPMGMREAIWDSDNIVAAKWMNTIKPEQVIPLARDLGIGGPLHSDLTLALGTSEVTVLEMTRAFATFPNGGYRVEPLAILRIVDQFGTVLVDNRPRAVKVLDERISYILTDIMKGVLKPGGTAGQVSWLIHGRPAAAKTGTSEFSHDAWIIGYTPDLVAAVWTGNDDASKSLPGGLTGATLSAPIWADFINQALADVPHSDFRRPPGITAAKICSDSGLLATAGCPNHTELFLAGTQPEEYDRRWIPLPGLMLPPAPGMPEPAPATPGAPVPALPEPAPLLPVPAPNPGLQPPGQVRPPRPRPPGSPQTHLEVPDVDLPAVDFLPDTGLPLTPGPEESPPPAEEPPPPAADSPQPELPVPLGPWPSRSPLR